MFVMGAAFHQVLTTSVDTGSNEYSLDIFSINSSNGDLSTVATLVPDTTSVENSSTAYAAPLCTDRDGDHVYVVYPVDNVRKAERCRYWSSITCSIRNMYAAERIRSERRMPCSIQALSSIHQYQAQFTRHLFAVNGWHARPKCFNAPRPSSP